MQKRSTAASNCMSLYCQCFIHLMIFVYFQVVIHTHIYIILALYDSGIRLCCSSLEIAIKHNNSHVVMQCMAIAINSKKIPNAWVVIHASIKCKRSLLHAEKVIIQSSIICIIHYLSVFSVKMVRCQTTMSLIKL